MSVAAGRDRPERDRSDATADGRDQRPPSTAERVTLGIGLAVILGLIGLVVFLYVADGDAPPLIEAIPLLADVRRENGTYALRIAIANRGDRTARDVLVLVALATDGEPPETAEFTVDFLAGGETIEVTAVLSADPGSGTLDVDVAGYR
jgi:uncharacterized protein (TIGR02588 family)